MSGDSRNLDGGDQDSNQFHVHFNVNALDTEGVDRVLRKHRKLFADHFFKEAKKRGFK